jgi:hypothetical protein
MSAILIEIGIFAGIIIGVVQIYLMLSKKKSKESKPENL